MHFAVCQAQVPGLGRPLGPGAVQPATAQLGAKPPTAAAGAGLPISVPGVPEAAAGGVHPSTGPQSVSNVPGQAVAVPGGAQGVTAGQPATGVPGQPGAPGQRPATLPGAAVPAPGAGIVPSPAVGSLPQALPGVAFPGVVSPGVQVPGVPVPSPAAAALSPPVHVASPAPGVLAAQASVAAGQSSQETLVGVGAAALGAITINPATTAVRSGFTWAVSKRFSSQAKTLSLSIPAGTGTVTASYQLTVTKSLTTQVVTVAGSFPVTGTGAFTTPVLSYVPAPAAVPSGAVTCTPPTTAPSTCQFQQTWSDSSITATAGGVVTATMGTSTVSAPYSFTAGASGSTTGNCAVVSDNFAAGQLTGTNMQMSGNYPPTGMQTCDTGDKLFEYTVTFSNMQSSWCSSPISVSAGITHSHVVA